MLHKEAEPKNYPEILKFIVDTLNSAEDDGAKIYSIIVGFSGIIDSKLSKTLLSTVVDVDTVSDTNLIPPQSQKLLQKAGE